MPFVPVVDPNLASGVLASTLVEMCRWHLLGGAPEDRDKLDTAVNDTTTTISFTYGQRMIAAGKFITVDLEDMFVWETAGNGATLTATVERAQRGTQAAQHFADALVYVQPRWSPAVVFRSINSELLDLASPANGLYRMRVAETDAVSGQTGYDLTGVTDLLSVYQVFYEPLDSVTKNWPVIDGWRLQRDQDAGDFASGLTLNIYEAVPDGRRIRIQYKAPFTKLETLEQDVQGATGLPETANELVAVGAAHRLVPGKEVRRNDAERQGDTRRPGEVPPGAIITSYSGLRSLRQQLLRDEAARLHQRYPIRKRRSIVGDVR